MKEWSQELTLRRFHPREAAAITTVPPGIQRSNQNRYPFDYRMAKPETGVRLRWTWEGLQLLTAFVEMMADLKDANLVMSLLRMDEGDDKHSIDEAMNFDWRNSPETGDFLIYHDFVNPIVNGILTSKELSGLFAWKNTDIHPKRVYIYNLSDMQRRLCDAMGYTSTDEDAAA